MNSNHTLHSTSLIWPSLEKKVKVSKKSKRLVWVLHFQIWGEGSLIEGAINVQRYLSHTTFSTEITWDSIPIMLSKIRFKLVKSFDPTKLWISVMEYFFDFSW